MWRQLMCRTPRVGGGEDEVEEAAQQQLLGRARVGARMEIALDGIKRDIAGSRRPLARGSEPRERQPKALNKKYQQSGGRGNFCTPCNHPTYRVTAVIIFLVPNFFAHLVEKKIPMPTQLRKNFLRHP